MKGRVIHWLLVAVFACALGHLAWHSFLGPAPVPDFLVGGEVPAMVGPEPASKHLYARRVLTLSQHPRYAWIQVLGRDRLQVFVNGTLVGGQARDRFPVAVLSDIAPYLNAGPNVIAIHDQQSSVGRPPIVAVEGAITLDDGEHPLQTDGLWRCGTAFERKASWWFTAKFDEHAWPCATLTTCSLKAKLDCPPRAITSPAAGSWITPSRVEGNSASVRREFDVDGRPSQAWLRVTTTGAYRLGINGILLDQREERVGARLPPAPVQRIL